MSHKKCIIYSNFCTENRVLLSYLICRGNHVIKALKEVISRCKVTSSISLLYLLPIYLFQGKLKNIVSEICCEFNITTTYIVANFTLLIKLLLTFSLVMLFFLVFFYELFFWNIFFCKESSQHASYSLWVSLPLIGSKFVIFLSEQ